LKYQTHSSSHSFARGREIHDCRWERRKREGEDVVTGGEKLQDRSKIVWRAGREDARQGERKTKTLLCFCIVKICYSKGEKPKGVFIGKGKRGTTNPRLLI